MKQMAVISRAALAHALSLGGATGFGIDCSGLVQLVHRRQKCLRDTGYAGTELW